MNTQPKVKEAIDRAGGVAAVAAYFEISPVSVYEWIKRGCVPADKCPEIEKFSNGAARCEEMNNQVDWQFLRSSQPAAALDSAAARQPATRRATDPEPDPGHSGRQPASPHNIFDTVPDGAVVTPLSEPPP